MWVIIVQNEDIDQEMDIIKFHHKWRNEYT